MTVVTASMHEDEARQITERIRALVISTRDQIVQLQGLLNEARDGEAWAALGYASWTAYLADVMGEQPLRLPRDQRREIVGYLAGEGMSTRAIAPIVGAHHDTVATDIKAGVGFPTPEPTVSTLTGEVPDDYVTDQADLDAAHELPEEAVDAARDSGDAEPSEAGELSVPSAPARSVTGLDGKQYTRTEPQTPRRRPLPDQARTAGWELAKSVERIQRIAEDDRFEANKSQMAPHLRSHLTNAISACQDLLTRIN